MFRTTTKPQDADCLSVCLSVHPSLTWSSSAVPYKFWNCNTWNEITSQASHRCSKEVNLVLPHRPTFRWLMRKHRNFAIHSLDLNLNATALHASSIYQQHTNPQLSQLFNYVTKCVLPRLIAFPAITSNNMIRLLCQHVLLLARRRR